MELKEAMNIRKSIRSYTGEQISKEQLDAILTAANPIRSTLYYIHLSFPKMIKP